MGRRSVTTTETAMCGKYHKGGGPIPSHPVSNDATNELNPTARRQT
jgi:hypothetical protein